MSRTSRFFSVFLVLALFAPAATPLEVLQADIQTSGRSSVKTPGYSLPAVLAKSERPRSDRHNPRPFALPVLSTYTRALTATQLPIDDVAPVPGVRNVQSSGTRAPPAVTSQSS